MFTRAPDGRMVLDRTCPELDGLLAGLGSVRGGALVVRGAEGVGKSTMLDLALARAPQCRVVRLPGVEVEADLGMAAIHRLCEQLDGPDVLPVAEADALRAAFHLGAVPDTGGLLVGLAVRSLLIRLAEARPVVVVVDDADRLDRPSAQALALVARRLGSVPIVIVFAARERRAELEGLTEVAVGGLTRDEARSMVDRLIPGPFDEEVLARIVAEVTDGPIRLTAPLRAVWPGALAGGFASPDAVPVTEPESLFRADRLRRLPTQTQRLLLVAAADPLGRPQLLWRASAALGIPVEAADPAVADGWLRLGRVVRFPGPSTRSAVYRAAGPRQRRRAHRALAAVTDPVVSAEWHAWHRGAAAAGADDLSARTLTTAARRVRRRAGLAATGRLLEQAAALTADPAERSGRLLAAAEVDICAGASEAVGELLARIDPQDLSPDRTARLDSLVARTDPVPDHSVARRLRRCDARTLRWYDTAPALLDRIAADLAAENEVRTAVHERRGTSGELRADADGQWLSLAAAVAADLGELDLATALASRHRDCALADGALTADLQRSLATLGLVAVDRGDFAAADDLVDQAMTVNRLASHSVHRTALALAALRGREPEATRLLDGVRAGAGGTGDEALTALVDQATAVLRNGLGDYRAALAAAHRASQGNPPGLIASLAELIEAAARCDETPLARSALHRLRERAAADQTVWARGMEALARALLDDDDAADDHFRSAIDLLGRCSAATALARTRLLYGELLRRRGQRGTARQQLRLALDQLTAMGADGFAQRAERELLATGERQVGRSAQARVDLTAQESEIARLASVGHSNPEIATTLFISPRTVEYHLTKVFSKLSITSRNQLHLALPAPAGQPEAPDLALASSSRHADVVDSVRDARKQVRHERSSSL